MKLWGQNFTRNEIMKHIGDITQLCGVKSGTLTDGPGRGMRVIDVNSGAGLSFSVLPDRGMDIAWCHYKGIPISFMSKTGAVAPQLTTYPQRGFLRGFYAGLLTTCGYTHMGAACVDEGVALGMHGRANVAPSDDTSARGRWEDDEYIIKIEGHMRESAVFHENIHHFREIKVKAGENTIYLTDRIENEAYEEHPFMLLYHFNFGFPLVSADSHLETSAAASVVPRDEAALPGFDVHKRFQSPTHQYDEQVYYHDLIPDEEGKIYGTIVNPVLGIGATVRVKKDQLPYFIQWKQMGEGDYTCGLEPATWYPEGRDKARERNELLMIGPRERKVFELEIEIYEL